MADRYFVEVPVSTPRAVLSGAEAHHLIHVMRAKPGMAVTLFDGSGAEFSALVERLGRSEVELQIVARQQVDRELPLDLALGVSLPKGDRQKWLVEKAVELGVRRVVPLLTSRSVAQPAGAVARLRRTVIEASKQCGRNRLMEICAPSGWADFVGAEPEVSLKLLAHPAGENVLGARDACSDEPVRRAILAIGPEGGFAEEELALARSAGWRLVNLGPRILRVETAAILLVAKVIAKLPP
ncbi:MAG: 16S rRNA (uracil(1498)-N(3))-methyltransferase [Thermoguttaceae bacterium]|jgi:16S rRNA (uracil1498-N3)-methyltransferase